MLNVEQCILHGLRLVRAPAHRLLEPVADVGVPGLTAAPDGGGKIRVGVLFSQLLDVLVAELVSRHEDADGLVGVLGHEAHGDVVHLRGLAAAGRCHQQGDRRFSRYFVAINFERGALLEACALDGARDPGKDRRRRDHRLRVSLGLGLDQLDGLGVEYSLMVETPVAPVRHPGQVVHHLGPMPPVPRQVVLDLGAVLRQHLLQLARNDYRVVGEAHDVGRQIGT